MCDLVQAAKSYAICKHESQLYGSHPYSFHLESVANLVINFGEQITIIAWLHDVLEDTSATYNEVKELFGARVADCVLQLTDEPGDTREARKEKTHLKLANTKKQHLDALIVKTADRLSNVRACLNDKNIKYFDMYAAEHKAFRAAVYREGLCDELWQELDRLIENSNMNQ